MLTDLRMFADGTGLSKRQIAELKDSGMIYSDGVQWMLTERGREMLTSNKPGWLDKPADEEHSQHYYDCERNKPQPSEVKQTALDIQIGGTHYWGFKIQPAEFIEANKLPFFEGCVIKRMCRHGAKAGVQDLLKAKHEIDLIIQLRYGVTE